MNIKELTTVEVSKMRDSEGLVLQGCGGDLQEWVVGINKLLVDKGIVKSGKELSNIASFKYNDLTCLTWCFLNQQQHT